LNDRLVYQQQPPTLYHLVPDYHPFKWQVDPGLVFLTKQLLMICSEPYNVIARFHTKSDIFILKEVTPAGKRDWAGTF